MNLTITPDGTIRGIYSDDLTDIIEQGEARITRASHVEPFADGGWYADMRPSGGPVLFEGVEFHIKHDDDITTQARASILRLHGFSTRAAALAAEVAWLEENRGL